MAMKFHRMTLNKTGDGRVSVTVDILGPISDPLDGLTMKERLQVYLWPFGWNERAMMRAVKDLPTIARRAVVADIMVARREKFEERQSERGDKVSAQLVAMQGVVLPRIQPKPLPVVKPLPIIEVSAYDVEPGIG